MSALRLPRFQDHEAPNDDVDGCQEWSKHGWRCFTDAREDEVVLPQRCSKLKLNTQEYSVEYCDHNRQGFIERGLPKHWRATRAVAARVEDEDYVPNDFVDETSSDRPKWTRREEGNSVVGSWAQEWLQNDGATFSLYLGQNEEMGNEDKRVGEGGMAWLRGFVRIKRHFKSVMRAL